MTEIQNEHSIFHGFRNVKYYSHCNMEANLLMDGEAYV